MFRKPHQISNAQATLTYQKGLAAFESGRYLDAIELLKTISEERSLAATLAKFYLGQAHMHQGAAELQGGRFDDATAHFQEARRINPDSAALAQYLAKCHFGAGRFDEASVEMERAHATGEPDATLPIRLAHAFASDGRIDRAVETLQQALRQAPYRADLHFQLGVIYSANQDYKEALTAFTDAAARAPLDAEIVMHRGLAHAACNEMGQAASCLSLAQRLRPHDAHIAMLLTMAVQAAQTQSQPNLRQMATPTKARDNDAALDLLGQVIVNEPDFVEAFLSLPGADVDTDVFGMLAATMERALERHPDHADLHYHCSRVQHRLGHTMQAIDRANSAVSLNPRFVQALIQLGKLFAETNQWSDAIERLNEAVASGGDYADVHYLIGELYRRTGRTPQARASYERALQINSKYRRAREALEAVGV